MTRFYISLDCWRCDAEILHGPIGTLIEHEGLPVIPHDIAAQDTFECGDCGASSYTGELDVYVDEDDDSDGDAR